MTRDREAPVAASAAIAELRGRAGAGAPPADLRGLPGRLRRAVELAELVGAPLLPAVDAASAALDDDRRAHRALRVATAQARAVGAGLVLLPVLLVPALGRLLGIDLVAFYASGPGLIVLLVAAALALVGVVAIATIIRRVGSAGARGRGGVVPAVVSAVLVASVVGPWACAAVGGLVLVLLRRPRVGHAGLEEAVDLVAVALGGGCGTAEALRVAADAGVGPVADLRRLALAVDLGHDVRELAPTPLAAVVAATGAWGAPAAESLRALARDLRAEALADALAAAERLPAQLTFPTALCLLPASVLLIGAPLVVDGLAAAAGAG